MDLAINILNKELTLYKKSEKKSAELYSLGEITGSERYEHKINLEHKIKQLEQAIKILKDERTRTT